MLCAVCHRKELPLSQTPVFAVLSKNNEYASAAQPGLDELECLFYDNHLSCQCAQYTAQSHGRDVTNSLYKLAEGT